MSEELSEELQEYDYYDPETAKVPLEEALAYMVRVADDYYDPEIGEYNVEMLAEEAAHHFDLYAGPRHEHVPEWVYDLAGEVPLP